jgi:osmotically-inducible protein OsmY
MTDEELARSVADELYWDPRIDSQGVAASAADGMVVLRGTVSSFHQKREATKAAERVRGVVAVSNRIDVEILIDERREDADLRGDVLEALMLDAQVPTTVDARVREGSVVLAGEADWQYQRDEAERVAGNVPGVHEVVNKIVVGDSRYLGEDVERTIRKAFLRSARLDAEHLEVTVTDGTIRLAGQVQSRLEHDEAVAVAWAVPGVRSVDDRLVVGSLTARGAREMSIRAGKAKADQVLGQVEEILGESNADPAAQFHGEALRLRGEAEEDALLDVKQRVEVTPSAGDPQ